MTSDAKVSLRDGVLFWCAAWKAATASAVRFGLSNTSACMTYLRGATNYLFNREADGSIGGDGIDVLSPTAELVSECNRAGKSNDLSIVLQLHYAGFSMILPGDAEALAWDSLVKAYGSALQCNVLKASHHGRLSGYDLKSLQVIKPWLTVASVGRKPSTDAHARYAYALQRIAGPSRLSECAYSSAPLSPLHHRQRHAVHR